MRKKLLVGKKESSFLIVDRKSSIYKQENNNRNRGRENVTSEHELRRMPAHVYMHCKHHHEHHEYE